MTLRQTVVLAVVAVAWSGPLAGQASPSAKYPVATAFDSASGVTTRSVEVQHGRHFIRFHRPRVTVATVSSATGTPAQPDSVLIEFRTQSPQYTATNLLVLTAPGDLRVEAVASQSRVKTHIQTTDHTLTFVLPAAALQPFLRGPSARMTVGGVKVDLKSDQLAAIAALLAGS